MNRIIQTQLIKLPVNYNRFITNSNILSSEQV